MPEGFPERYITGDNVNYESQRGRDIAFRKEVNNPFMHELGTLVTL
jgi:hypothetical protein